MQNTNETFLFSNDAYHLRNFCNFCMIIYGFVTLICGTFMYVLSVYKIISSENINVVVCNGMVSSTAVYYQFLLCVYS